MYIIRADTYVARIFRFSSLISRSGLYALILLTYVRGGRAAGPSASCPAQTGHTVVTLFAGYAHARRELHYC